MAYHVVSKSTAARTLPSGSSRSGPYNKRRGISPIPNNLVEFLNHQQLVSLRQMEVFGWRLSFIRRIGEDQAITIVSNGKRHAKLESDGSLNSEVDLNFRVPNQIKG